MKNFTVLDWIAFGVLVVGGVNWGLIGFFNFDLVSTIFGVMSAASRVIFGLVGLSALYAISWSFRD